MRRLAVTSLCALHLLGCSDARNEPSDDHVESFTPLVLLDGWSGVSRQDDPFVEDSEATPACVGSGFRVEDDHWLELDTGLCNWVTLRGSARYAVDAEQLLDIEVSHYDLEARAPAEAEMRLTLEGCDAWSKTIPIPSPAAVYEEELASPCALTEGGSVLFHLHNHGQNTDQFRSIGVLR